MTPISPEYTNVLRAAYIANPARLTNAERELLFSQFHVGEKESLAVVECEQVLTECRIAEALADAAKKHLDAEQSILSSIQSRARLQQVEANLANYK